MLTRQEIQTETDLIPYVIEPDEIYIPMRPVRVEPVHVGTYERVRLRTASPVRRGRIAAGVVVLVVLIVATAETLMSAPRVTVPALPAPPAMLVALPSEPPAPLDTKELPLVEGLSGITTDSLFGSPAQFSRAMLVRTQGRTSMALEMTAEPGKATLQTVSPTV